MENKKTKNKHPPPSVKRKCVFTYVEMLYFDVFFQAAWSVGEILTLITLEPHFIVAHFRKIQSNFLKKCYCLRVLTQKVLR